MTDKTAYRSRDPLVTLPAISVTAPDAFAAALQPHPLGVSAAAPADTTTPGVSATRPTAFPPPVDAVGPSTEVERDPVTALPGAVAGSATAGPADGGSGHAAAAGPPCGTDAAYQRHYRQGLRGDQIDPACRAAHSARGAAGHRKARARHQDLPPCTACEGPRKPREGAHGWCTACLLRWVRAERPDDGPPPPRERLWRHREEFVFLREQGESVETVAARLQLSLRTVKEWEKRRKAEEYRRRLAKAGAA